MSFLHKIFASILGSKPSVHLWQPRSVSLYFKNALFSKYKLLNLKNYDCLEISIQQENIDNNEIVYKLNIIALSGENKATINVAVFETPEDAEKASLILRNKLFSPGQIFLKISLSIILSLVSILVIFSLLFGGGNVANNNSNLTKLEQQKLIEQLKLQDELQGLSPMQMPQGLDPTMFIAPQGGQAPMLPNNMQMPSSDAMRQAIMEANSVMNEGEKERTAAEQMYAPIPETPVVPESRIELPQDPKIKGFIDALN